MLSSGTRSAVAALALALAFVSLAANAEESSRECIRMADGDATNPLPGKTYSYQIAATPYPNATWQSLGKLSFQVGSPSDIMIQAAGFLSEANTPGLNVTYGLFLTNHATGVESQISQINTRIPGNVPSTHTFRAFAPNVPAGVHTIKIKVLNTNPPGAAIRYYGFWIGPALVDSSESTVINQSATPVTLTNTWTTVAEATMNVTSAQMLLLAGWLEWASGSTGQGVNYRFVRYAAGVESPLADFADSIEGATPAGQSIAYIYAAPAPGASTIRLQARLTTSGTSAQIGPRHLWLQTTPRYSVMEGSFVAASIDNESPPSGVAGRWRLDYDAKDTGGSSHGILRNMAPDWVGGMVGAAALRFDGVDDYVEIPSASMPPAYTVTAWVRPELAAGQNVFVRTSSSGPLAAWSDQIRIDSSGRFQHYLWDGGTRTVTGSTVVAPRTWYHVAITAQNGGQMALYVNGASEGLPVSIGTAWVGDRHYIGSNSNGFGYFSGVVDDVRIYNRVLSAAEIAKVADEWTLLGSSNSVTMTAGSPSMSGRSAFGNPSQRYIAGFGFGHVAFANGSAGSPPAEVQLKTDFIYDEEAMRIESGQLDAGYAGKRKLQSLMTNGDGKIGLWVGGEYRTEALAIGLCPYDSPDVPTLSGGRFQIALQADEYPFLDIHCSLATPPADWTIQCCIPEKGCTFVCRGEAAVVEATLRSCWGS
jgi:hypothetical protein